MKDTAELQETTPGVGKLTHKVDAKIGIPQKDTAKVAAILNQLLADQHVLYVKTRNYHWNVVGPSFMEYHLFFERLYNEMAENIDEIAERVRSLGEHTVGSMAEYLAAANLKETKQPFNEPLKMAADLLHDHEWLCTWLRDQIDVIDTETKDTGTADFLTGILEYHEKRSWMLRAYQG
ncbi:MAG: DNA starvation/stationary phase protection protein [Siphonobacter sp.]